MGKVAPRTAPIRVSLAFSTVVLAAAALGMGLGPRIQSPGDRLYRLNVAEPREGQTVSAGTVRVAVELEARGQEPGAPRNPTATPVPLPQIEIFLDKESKGIIGGQGVVLIEGVPAGVHTLLVTATDRSGPVVDRKQIHFSALSPSVD